MGSPQVGMWLKSSGPYWGDSFYTGVVCEVRTGIVVVDSTEREHARNWCLGSFWSNWKQVGWKQPSGVAGCLPDWMTSGTLLRPNLARLHDVDYPTLTADEPVRIEEVRGAWARLSSPLVPFYGLYRSSELRKWFSPVLSRFQRELAL